MKRNIIIFLTFLIFVVFYICYDNFNFVSAISEGLSFYGSYEKFGCPWGNNHGNDVGVQTIKIYCDDNDENCEEEEGAWFFHKRCDDCQYCNKTRDGDYICKQDYPPLSPRKEETVPKPVTLNWCNIEGATSYRIQICKRWYENNSWKEECLDELSSTESAICTRSLELEDNRYEWQIASNYGSFGSKWVFYTEGEQEIGKPVLVDPLDWDDIWNVNRTTNSIPVTIKWEGVTDAKSYYVEVYKDRDVLVASGYYPADSRSLILTINSLTNSTDYRWTVAACLGENGTACGPDCCFNERGNECSDPSTRIFRTNNDVIFNKVELISPNDGAPSVKPSDLFKWQSQGATGFIFEIKKDRSLVLRRDTQDTSTTSSDFTWEDEPGVGKLAFNTYYDWRVVPCWWNSTDSKVEDCGGGEATEQSFRTSGGIIDGSTLSPKGNDAPTIPVSFSWEEVPNAFSYLFQLTEEGDIITTRNNKISLDYPDVKPLTTYSWKVKACAETNGTFCENSWHTENFTTEEFKAPSSKQLGDGTINGEVFTYENNIVWDPVPSVKSYKYTIQYNTVDEKEANDNCEAGTLIKTDIISNSNYILMPNFPGIQQKCLGEYTLWVTACLTENCENQNDENSTTTAWTFDYIQSQSSGQGGIMPCGKDYDLENTPWNEREACQLKHVPVLAYNVLDFILWKASLIAFLILIIFSGIISYASAGLPIKVVSLKEVWITAGKGYVVMFFAWTIISLILNLLGITDSFLMLPSFL